MTKQEAICKMVRGFKVRHKYFSPDEWVTMKNGTIHLEDGVSCSPYEFWRWRTDEDWLTNWEMADNDFVDDVNDNYSSYEEAKDDLTKKGYNNLGWINSGITLPQERHWFDVYSNRRGTSCIYADAVHREFYSVDMGD